MAAFVGQPLWAAVAGSGLVIVYWALESLTWWRARDRRDLALGLALSGMAVRLIVVLAALVIVGVLDKGAFAATAISFLATFTLYVVLRPFMYPTASPPAGQARLQ